MSLKPMPGWLNPSYTLPSTNVANQRLQNFYAEVLEVEGEKVVGFLRSTPGLSLPLVTLPTAPLRGLLAGGTPLNPLSGSGGRMFAVAGSKLYEVMAQGAAGTVTTTAAGNAVTWASGSTFGPGMVGKTIVINAVNYTVATVPTMFTLTLTTSPGNQATAVAYAIANLAYYTQRGEVGDDGLPVTLLPNGNQLGIISAGQFYIDNGLGPVLATFQGYLYTDIAVGWNGTCDTSGPFVIRATGVAFNQGMAGKGIVINALNYTVATVLDGDNLMLTTSAGIQAGVTYTAGSNTSVTSVAVPFAQADVGSSLVFPAAGSFSAVTVTVASVDAYGNATLSASPAAVGSIDGTAQQTMGPVKAGSGAYLDTFFVVAPANTKQIYVSAPLDGTTWDAADTATKESYPDNIGKILADHEELFVWGENRSEVWRAPGMDPNFPFQRDPGACMSLGIAAPESACAALLGVAWIGGDNRGQPVAYYAQGYVPQRISTHAVEQVWAGYAEVADAVGFDYELNGHIFWQVSFPTADATWVYDFTASQQMGKHCWHERNCWDGAAFHRHRASCHCYVFGKHWVGDFATGAIYQMSSDIYTDNGQVMTCIRTLPHLSAGRLRQFFFYLQIDLETAIGAVPFTILLEWSDDGGHTWVGGGSAFTYTTSTTLTNERVTFWQLGSADDRVFRLTVTGNARKSLANAYLDSIVGT